ncbi:MAG: carbohydrate kinase family protein [Candidatus Freyarchaeota archaeon]
MKKTVSVIGALNVDLIIRGNAPTNMDDLVKWTGASEVWCITAGSVGYLIQDLIKLGFKVNVLSTTSDDPFSLIIRDSLKKLGINTDFIRREENTLSGIGIYILLFGSNKRPLTYRIPTHNLWGPKFTKEEVEYAISADHLHCGGYLHFPKCWGAPTIEVFQEAKENGLTTSLDPQFPLHPLREPWIKHMKNLLKYVDIIMVDENEAINSTHADSLEEAANIFLKQGPDIVAIKLGSQGCFVKSKTQSLKKPAIPVENIIDTIGAGDAFDSGLITGYLEGMSLDEMVDMALKIASYSIQGVGGTEAIPYRKDIHF